MVVAHRVGWGQVPLVVMPLYMAAVFGGSILLGLVAGAYPAWLAARTEVLDVLKGE
jgi:putative ABC transport system permease protein